MSNETPDSETTGTDDPTQDWQWTELEHKLKNLGAQDAEITRANREEAERVLKGLKIGE